MIVTCQVRRQNPGQKPYWARYEVEVVEGSAVIDILHALSGRDPGLAHTTHHCKTGICGACSLIINGRRRLACRTLVDGSELRLEPVPGLPLIKDLLMDLLPLHEKAVARRREQ